MKAFVKFRINNFLDIYYRKEDEEYHSCSMFILQEDGWKQYAISFTEGVVYFYKELDEQPVKNVDVPMPELNESLLDWMKNNAHTDK